MWTLYKHTAPNGKIYIGITSHTIEIRGGKNGTGYKPKGNNKSRFWNAIKKYGWDNFKHEVILTDLTQEEANRLEKEYIAYYKTQDKRYGYNITEGGNGHCGCESSFKGKQHTEEAKEKNRQAHLGKTAWNKGLTKDTDARLCSTDERNKKISDATTGENNPMFGKKHKDESKQKMSDSLVGMFAGENNPMYGVHRYGEENPMFGKKQSDETKLKIKVAKLYNETFNTNNKIWQRHHSILLIECKI